MELEFAVYGNAEIGGDDRGDVVGGVVFKVAGFLGDDGLTVSLKAELDAGFSLGCDGELALGSGWKNPDRSGEALAGNDNVGEFDGRSIDDGKLGRLTTAGQQQYPGEAQESEGLSHGGWLVG